MARPSTREVAVTSGATPSAGPRGPYAGKVKSKLSKIKLPDDSRIALFSGGGEYRTGFKLQTCRSLHDSGKHIPSVNIAIVNELMMFLDRIGIVVGELIDPAKTQPFGFQSFYSGSSLGGHCIPIDRFCYLSWVARNHGKPTLLAMTTQLAAHAPRALALTQNVRRSIAGSKANHEDQEDAIAAAYRYQMEPQP